jgi:hypothetical protein
MRTRSQSALADHYFTTTELGTGVETQAVVSNAKCLGVLPVAPVMVVTVVDCWTDANLFHVLRILQTVCVCAYVCKCCDVYEL